MHHFNKFIFKYNKHLFIIALGTADVKVVCEILAEEEKEEASLKKQLEKKLVDNKVFSPLLIMFGRFFCIFDWHQYTYWQY